MQLETAFPAKQEICEATLKRFDAYIVSQARQLRSSFSVVVHPAVFDLEIDDLIQRVRINFWRALARREINHPHAYIKRMIHNEIVDIARQQKRIVPFPTDEEWGGREARKEWEPRMPDSAEEVEQRMDALCCLNEVVQAILKLPPRQRLAMICSLQERVDDRAQLIHAFKMHRVDIEAMHWPTEKKEKHLIQASLTPARKALIKNLKK
jgi:RNA polymerase sigma factor (sigma-70 family)